MLAEKINAEFGSFDDFKSSFATAAAGVFGSGWAWLAVAKDGSVKIVSTPNQDNPLMDGKECCLPVQLLQSVLALDSACPILDRTYFMAFVRRYLCCPSVLSSSSNDNRSLQAMGSSQLWVLTCGSMLTTSSTRTADRSTSLHGGTSSTGRKVRRVPTSLSCKPPLMSLIPHTVSEYYETAASGKPIEF